MERTRTRKVMNVRAVGLAFLISIACHPRAAADGVGGLPEVYTHWQTYTTRDGLPHDRIRALRAFDSQLWVGTDGGLALRQGPGWKSWTERDGLPRRAISAIDVDAATMDVWIGTWGGGLVRLSGGRLAIFDQFNSGLAGNLVFAVAAANGRIWAATNGGLSAYDPAQDSWELFAERRADAPDTVVMSLFAERGDLYAASWCEGLRRLSSASGRWTLVRRGIQDLANRRESAEPHDDLAVGVAGIDGVLWCASQTRLYRRDRADRWDSQRIGPESSAAGFVQCVAAENGKKAWVGTTTGFEELSDERGGSRIRYQRLDSGWLRATLSRGGAIAESCDLGASFPDNRIRCIAVTGQDIWIGTAGGLARGTERRRWDRLVHDKGSRDNPLVRPSEIREASEKRAVVIAVLGSGTRTIALPGASGTSAPRTTSPDPMAVDWVVNQLDSGIRVPGGLRVELARGTEGFVRYAWGLPEDDLADAVLRHDATAAVGHLGPDSRLTSATILRAELPVVNTAATLPTADEALNPWVFRCPINDPRNHAALLDDVLRVQPSPRIAVIRTPDPLAQLHLNWWVRYGRAAGHAPVVDLRLDSPTGHCDEAMASLERAHPTIVLTWCNADNSLLLLRSLRARGIRAVFAGSDQIVREDFCDKAGPDPGVVIALDPCRHRLNREAWDRFARGHRNQRQGAQADEAVGVESALTFDATLHLLDALVMAGVDRDAVRDCLRQLGAPRIATMKGGRWERRLLSVSR